MTEVIIHIKEWSDHERKNINYNVNTTSSQSQIKNELLVNVRAKPLIATPGKSFRKTQKCPDLLTP
jgi:hypothetical protein